MTSSLEESGSDKLMGYTLGMLKSAAQKVTVQYNVYLKLQYSLSGSFW